jgi:hypothetical protein
MSIDPITAVLDISGKVIDRIWPDPAQAASAKLELIKLQQSGELQEIAGQLEINKIEASNSNLFVSGWRPFVGWCCGAGCAWNWLGLPVFQFIFTSFGHPVNVYPADISEMMPLLFGLLGIGTMRTYEKVKGVKNPGK